MIGTVAQVEAALADRAVGDEIQISGVTGLRGGTLVLAGTVGGFAVGGRASSHPFPNFPVAVMLRLSGTLPFKESLESCVPIQPANDCVAKSPLTMPEAGEEAMVRDHASAAKQDGRAVKNAIPESVDDGMNRGWGGGLGRDK